MKKLYILILLIFVALSSNAATADYIFLNNNTSATSLDLEIRVKAEDTVFVRVNGISYITATALLTIPSSTLLKFTFFNTGTATVFYTNDNVVLNDNTFMIGHLYGSSSSTRYSQGTAYKQSSSGTKIKYDFINSTSSLQEIDLTVRGGSAIADNFVYGNRTTTFSNEMIASNMILDVTPFNSGNGLFAYNLNASTLGGEYLYLFTAGTGTSLTMYMLQVDGTVTQLTTTTPIVSGIRNRNVLMLSIFPNPVSDVLHIENYFSGGYNLELSDMNGKSITSVHSHSNGEGISLNVSDLPEGLFVCTIKSGNNVYTGRVSIRH